MGPCYAPWVNRTVAISILLHAILAAVLCFVPLFNLLSYEFSLAIGLFTAVTSFAIGLQMAGSGTPRNRSIVRIIGFAWLQLLLPLLLISLNALRVRNCDFSVGLTFFLLLPCLSAALSAMLGITANTLFAPKTYFHKLGSALLMLGLPLGSILWDLYFEAPIAIYSHLWGFSAGTVYDEAIFLNSRLAIWRGVSLLAIGCMWGFTIACVEYGLRKRTRWVWGLVLLAGFLGIDSLVGTTYGYRVNRHVLSEHLPLVVKGDGIVIHLPGDTPPKRAENILHDHLFQLDQLKAKLELEELPTIHSYVHASAKSKGELLGGHKTMFAKPWLFEIHIYGLETPHSVLAHELVHAAAAVLCNTILRVPSKFGVIPNMGLVEGFAEAFTTPRGKLGLHAFARSMRDMGVAPNLKNTLAAEDFWRQAPARAYTITGSFVRYLLETYGPSPVKELYKAGNFQSAFGKNLDTLVNDWNTFLDTVNVPDTGRRTAQATFTRRAIFERPCAHVVAQLRQEARDAGAKAGLPLQQKICDFEGNTPSARYRLALAYLRAAEEERFLTLGQTLLSENSLRPYQRNRLFESMGNLYWRDGKHLQAKKFLSDALETGVDLKSRRKQWVMLNALDSAAADSSGMREYLSRKMKTKDAARWIKNLADNNLSDPTVTYLYGRNLFNQQKWRASISVLESISSHPYPPIASEIHRVQAEAAWNLRKYHEATQFYLRYAEQAPNSGEYERANEWLARIEWTVKQGF